MSYASDDVKWMIVTLEKEARELQKQDKTVPEYMRRDDDYLLNRRHIRRALKQLTKKEVDGTTEFSKDNLIELIAYLFDVYSVQMKIDRERRKKESA